MQKQTTTSSSGITQNAIDSSILKAQEWLLSHQYPEGYWWGELESNVAITSEYLLLTHFMGTAKKDVWDRIASYLRREQRADGSWAISYGGGGDVSISVEAYFALKMTGASADEPFMAKAREFILSKGGVPATRLFTKIWLALFGQYDWRGIPVMPPEVMFFPNWFPLSIYRFASWARPTTVAMLVLLDSRPQVPVPDHANIDELYPEGRDRTRFSLKSPEGLLSWKSIFYYGDKVLRMYQKSPVKPFHKSAIRIAERWIVEHQEEDGSWGGIQPPWVYSLMALRSIGYTLDHPVVKKGLEGFKTFTIEDEEVFYTQPCLSPVWDTALASIALLDSQLPAEHQAVVRAGEWLIKEQILTGGDWQVKARDAKPGGWAFEFANDMYPDTDDAAEVMIALHKLRLPDEEKRKRSLALGEQWLFGMQSRNGGWGSFDKDNSSTLISQIPFCDFGVVTDPPTEDVTAHVLECLALLGHKRDEKAISKAIEYLKRTQQEDGCWWGRWGVNYVYGMGAVLPALGAVGEDMSQPYIRKAIQWLTMHQNPDGGWGENCDTYSDPSMRGSGPSTASQTSWALMALLAAGEKSSLAVSNGVKYLMGSQKRDGTWDEPYFTGTGFPRDFMINYHLYRHYFPLTALGRYRKATKEQ